MRRAGVPPPTGAIVRRWHPAPSAFARPARQRAASASRETNRSRTATRSWRRWRPAARSSAGSRPGADCHSTLGCLEALGVQQSRARGAVTVIGRGLDEFRSPEDAARCRQFRHDDAPAVRAPRRAAPDRSTSTGDASLAAAADEARHRPAHADGRPHRVERRPPPADDQGRRADGDRARTRGAERPGEERRPAGRPARAGHDAGDRAGADPEPHGARAATVRRRGGGCRAGRSRSTEAGHSRRPS